METPGRILIVDDDADMRELLGQELVAKGFQVRLAADGQEAKTLVEATPFDAIVTDIQMPRLNGLQLASAIKASGPNASTPVFVISGAVSNSTLERLASLQVVTLLPKPVVASEIAEVLRSTIHTQLPSAAVDPSVMAVFTSAASAVIAHFDGARPVLGAMAIHRGPMTCGYVTSMMQLRGDAHDGFVSCSFSQGVISRIMHRALEGSAPSEALLADISSELVNQMGGRIKAALSAMGIHVNAGLPQVVLGSGHKVLHRVSGHVVRFELRSGDYGSYLDFALRSLPRAAAQLA